MESNGKINITDFFNAQDAAKWLFNDTILKELQFSKNMDDLRKDYSLTILNNAPYINLILETPYLPCPFINGKTIAETHFISFSQIKNKKGKIISKWTMILFYPLKRTTFESKIKLIHPFYEIINDNDFEFITKEMKFTEEEQKDEMYSNFKNLLSNINRDKQRVEDIYLQRLI